MNYSRLLLPVMGVIGAVAGMRAQCPVDQEYPYIFCKNGVAVIRCASDPHHVSEDGIKLKPYKRTLPGCLTIEKRKILDLFMPTYVTGGDSDVYVPVFLADYQVGDITAAFNQWSGLCPPTDDHDCCAHVIFSDNPQDFRDDPEGPGFTQIQVDPETCKPYCDERSRTIILNDTPLWLWRTPDPWPGDSTRRGDSLCRSFFTGRFAPHVAQGYEVYSLYQMMEGLVGLWFGLRGGWMYPETQKCAHDGSVIENPVTETDPIDLTPEDICQFKKLYCDHEVGLGVDDERFSNSGLSLSQNVPNPFSAMTTISYSLREGGNVSLRIYDETGHEAKKLVDQRLEPGVYTYGFHVDESIPAGTYWYILQVDGKTLTKQMILIR